MTTKPKPGRSSLPPLLALALLILCGGLGQLLQLTLSPGTSGYLGILLGLTMGAVPAIAISILQGDRD